MLIQLDDCFRRLQVALRERYVRSVSVGIVHLCHYMFPLFAMGCHDFEAAPLYYITHTFIFHTRKNHASYNGNY